MALSSRQIQCFHCKEISQIADKVGFREECLKCRSDLHVCKNCQFYDAKVYNECRETSADVVREKERANFCDFFQARVPGASIDDQKAKFKAAADALFKK